jgi:tight adherence protein B
MTITVATFVLVFSIVLGAYRLAIAGPERRARRRLQHRLGSAQAPPDADVTLLRPADRMARARRAPIHVRPLYMAGAHVKQMIELAGWTLRIRTVALLAALSAAAGATLVYALSAGIAASIAGAAIGACVPVVAMLRARHARLRAFESMLPDATDVIARALRAGHPLPAALQIVGEEMPDPVGAEFRRLHDQFRYGMPLPEVMRGFADRVPLVDARFLATAILLQRETGGNLSELLDNLVIVIRDRFRVRRQVRTVTAHGRMTGWILSALPPVIAMALFVARPDYILTLVTDPVGMYLLGAALMLETAGVVFIRRIVNVEY